MDEADREFLGDMLQYAETAQELLGSLDAAALAADLRSFLAVSCAIQIVGEAATHVSAEVRDALPEIPWRKVIGMRHHIVHGYEQIRAEILVDTIRNDLPELIALLRRALEDPNP
ncbi:MAG TPA: HepT-like ribonuclease domain-containing protein [Afifellaceae bacterium]|nr:HepT-like ribonuclease domain-containing protein [Afifellaceae bacterium]